MAEGQRYRVIVTEAAWSVYEYSILPYLGKNFTVARTIEIEAGLMAAVQSLQEHPNRGSIETQLAHSSPLYRYILFRETRHFELKILYYVDDISCTVFVVDYFPTLMHPKRMTKPR